MASRSITLEYVNASTGVYTSNPKELHVAKTGNDTTGTGTDALPFLTINKAISLANYGTAIKVHEGVYSEVTGYPLGSAFFSLAALSDGSINRPIILQALEGDEGLVDVDCEGTKMGMQGNYKDYWRITGIRFVDCFWHGIMNYDLGSEWKTAPDQDPPTSLFSTGWMIDNCFIDVPTSNPGENSACISPWTTKDWIITNNKLKGVDGTDGVANGIGVNGIQSYGTINLKVYNNEFLESNFAVFIKDHYVVDSVTRETYQESEVYLNRVKCGGIAFSSGIRGTNSCESGRHYFHNNVVYGATSYNSSAYIAADMGGAYRQSSDFIVENNVFDVGATGRLAIFGSAFENFEVKGNVFVGTGSQDYQFRGNGDANHRTYLTESDYNVFTTAFSARMNIYGAGDTTFASMAAWNAATAGSPTSLAVSNPDSHSLASQSTAIFNNYAGGDYTPAAGSLLIGMMPDGSNVGAYQLGTEIIGVLPTYSAGV